MVPRVALRWAGRAFGIFTAVVGIIDIATDIMVCVQYQQQEIWVAFGLSLSILLIANLVYAIVTIEQGLLGTMPLFGRLGSRLRRRFKEKPPSRLLLYCVVLPIAQLALPVDWMLSTFWKETEQAEDGKDDDVKRPTLSGDSLYATVQWHWKTYILFYVETAAESLPQSILQIIVMTIRNEVTGMQIASIILSLVTIGSKAITLSQSFDIKVFFLKLSCLIFDLVLIFFTVSSLFMTPNASSMQCNVIFWGATDLSMVACVWLWMVLILWGLWPILGLFAAIESILDSYSKGMRAMVWKRLLHALPFLICGLLLPLPRCSILVAWLMLEVEPDTDIPEGDMDKRTFLAQLYKFVSTNKEFWDLKKKRVTAFLSHYFEEQQKQKVHLSATSISCCHKSRQWSLPCHTGLASAGPVAEFDIENVPAQVILKDICTACMDQPEDAKYEVYHCLSCQVDVCDQCARACHWWHSVQYLGVCSTHCQCNTKGTCLATPENQKSQALHLLIPEKVKPAEKITLPRPLRWMDATALAFLITTAAVLAFTLGCHILYGILYPILVVALQAHPFNAFHYFCLAFLAFLTPIITILAAFKLPTYIFFLRDFTFAAYGPQQVVFKFPSFPSIKEVARRCYVPTPERVLMNCLPPRMVCSDLTGVILQFLDLNVLPLVPSNSLLSTSMVLFPGRTCQAIPRLPQPLPLPSPDSLGDEKTAENFPDLYTPPLVMCPPSTPFLLAAEGSTSDSCYLPRCPSLVILGEMEAVV